MLCQFQHQEGLESKEGSERTFTNAPKNQTNLPYLHTCRTQVALQVLCVFIINGRKNTSHTHIRLGSLSWLLYKAFPAFCLLLNLQTCSRATFNRLSVWFAKCFSQYLIFSVQISSLKLIHESYMNDSFILHIIHDDEHTEELLEFPQSFKGSSCFIKGSWAAGGSPAVCTMHIGIQHNAIRSKEMRTKWEWVLTELAAPTKPLRATPAALSTTTSCS